MKKKLSRFFLFFKGIALRARMARAFDQNDTHRMYAVSRQIDALQRLLVLEAQPAPK